MIRGPLEADGRMAAKNAVKIRAALQEIANFKDIFEQYAETHPQPSKSRAMDRARARSWVIMNVRLREEALESAIWRTWAEAYVLGDEAAGEWIMRAMEAKKAPQAFIDWSKWKPGDKATALMLRRPKAYIRLLERSGILMNELKRTTFQDIGTSLADAIELGLDAVKASKLIARHVASPARALTIAITEQNRAMTASSMERYRQADIAKVEWEVSDPCPKCAQNANQIVNMGQPFNSGQTQPPAHPHCRCVLLPVIPGADEEGIGGSMTEVPPAAPVVSDLWDRTTPASKLRGRVVRESTMSDLYSDYKAPEASAKALRAYQENAFYKINADLRTGKPTTQIVSDLDALFESAPQLPGDQVREFYRVTESSVFKGMKKGDVFIDEGFTSVSISADQALEFGEQSMYDAKVRIIDTANRKKVWVDSITQAPGMSQGEVVLQRGTPFTYVGVDSDGYHVLVTGRRN